jgi:hypothetical protein
MKRIVFATAILALIASPAFAFESGEAGTIQNQTQHLNFTTGPGYFSTHYSADQAGLGGSNWNGVEGQFQQEGAHFNVNYAGNQVEYNLDSGTFGRSHMGLHYEAGTTDAVSVGTNDGYGQNAYAGAAIQTDRQALEFGHAQAGSWTKGYVAYKTTNSWYNRSQEVDGWSQVNTGAGKHNYGRVVSYTGAAAQIHNNGAGTQMNGATASESNIDSWGNAGGETGSYVHYSQTVNGYGTYQTAEGFSATSVSE